MSKSLPFPFVNFPKIIKNAIGEADVPAQLFSYDVSGELTSNIVGMPIGGVVESGVITDFLVALGNCGRDDTDDLSMSVNLKINGVTALSTPVVITGASDEAGVATFADTPTFANTSVVRGDLLTLDVTLTRTTPDTEMKTLYTTVKIVPAAS